MFDIEGISSTSSEGISKEGLSSSELDNIRESVEFGNAEIVVDRIDELSNRQPPLAIDSNPQVSEIIEPIRDQVPNEYLEAPSDIEQVEQISEVMQGIEGLDYDSWKNLTVDERLHVLQELENKVAEIEHRPASDVKMKDLGDPSVHKGYCQQNLWGNNSTLTLNSQCLSDSSMSEYFESLDTVIHEGRHAYQNYNLEQREVNSDSYSTSEWRQNMEDGYKSPEIYGFRAYWTQPVEVDARAFAQDVLDIYKESKGYLS